MSELTLKGELADRWPGWTAGETRRKSAGIKLGIYTEQYRPLLLDYINTVLGPGKVTEMIKKFALRSPNLLRSVTDSVAVSYQRGCARELFGLGETAADAFASIVAESGIDRLQNGINARSWLSGPVLTCAKLDSRNRLAFDVVNSDRFDIDRDGDYVDRALWYSQGTFIELTSEGWVYWNQDGEIVKMVPHSAGACPAVPFTSIDNTDDYWSSSDHAGLVDVTFFVGYKCAAGAYVSEVSSNMLTVVVTDLEKLPSGQKLGHHALPIELPMGSKVDVHDRIVPPTHYLSEISAHIAMAISAEGIPPGSVTMQANQGEWGNLAIAVEGSRLGVLRDRQVPHLRRHELELWPLVCQYLRGTSHKLAKKLPDASECRDALRISFPDLSSAKDALERINVLKAGLPLGITSVAEFMIASRPELTRSSSREEQQRNLKDYIDVIDPLVTRNVPADAGNGEGYQTISQQQGRDGGTASGEARRDAKPTDNAA